MLGNLDTSESAARLFLPGRALMLRPLVPVKKREQRDESYPRRWDSSGGRNKKKEDSIDPAYYIALGIGRPQPLRRLLGRHELATAWQNAAWTRRVYRRLF
jgi:hypothetical protein